MSSKREQYREAARECIRVAELTTDVKLRQILRQHFRSERLQSGLTREGNDMTHQHAAYALTVISVENGEGQFGCRWCS